MDDYEMNSIQLMDCDKDDKVHSPWYEIIEMNRSKIETIETKIYNKNWIKIWFSASRKM